MAAPLLITSKVNVDNCFSELYKSTSQSVTTINKLKKEIEELKAADQPEGTVVVTDKANEWLSDLELLEAHATAINENITTIATRINIRIGPWGGRGRSTFNFGQNSSRITKVILYTGTVIDSIQIHYMVGRDEIRTFRAGGTGGGLRQFDLQPTEYINSMVGAVGTFNGETCITKLEFTTNFGRKHGPFGQGRGTEFTVPIMDGRLVGFFGEFSNYINAIGVYMAR